MLFFYWYNLKPSFVACVRDRFNRLYKEVSQKSRFRQKNAAQLKSREGEAAPQVTRRYEHECCDVA
jgi:hypothetical protein